MILTKKKHFQLLALSSARKPTSLRWCTQKDLHQDTGYLCCYACFFISHFYFLLFSCITKRLGKLAATQLTKKSMASPWLHLWSHDDHIPHQPKDSSNDVTNDVIATDLNSKSATMLTNHKRTSWNLIEHSRTSWKNYDVIYDVIAPLVSNKLPKGM